MIYHVVKNKTQPVGWEIYSEDGLSWHPERTLDDVRFLYGVETLHRGVNRDVILEKQHPNMQRYMKYRDNYFCSRYWFDDEE